MIGMLDKIQNMQQSMKEMQVRILLSLTNNNND